MSILGSKIVDFFVNSTEHTAYPIVQRDLITGFFHVLGGNSAYRFHLRYFPDNASRKHGNSHDYARGL